LNFGGVDAPRSRPAVRGMLSGKQERKLSFNLSNKDHRRLDEMLGAIIDAHTNGEVSRSEAIGALAHVFTAAMIDNEGEVLSWLKPEV
jgi:hypothetical protein